MIVATGQAKPFLKWAGGKGQLIEQIRTHLPKEIVRLGKISKYFEPFVGGGAIFFWLAQEFEIEKAYLYDINPEIVMAYKKLKNKANSVINELKALEKEYKRLGTKKEAFYY